MLVGQRHRERRAGERTRGDEDDAQSLTRLSLLGQGCRELLLGEEAFEDQNFAEQGPLVGRIHTASIGVRRYRLKGERGGSSRVPFSGDAQNGRLAEGSGTRDR